MSSRRAKVLRKEQPQYSVYIYHKHVQQNDSTSYPLDWERRHKTFSLRSALRKAEKLYNSRAYERVEVHKVSFNKRLKRRIDKQLKIYKKKSDRPVGMLITAFQFFVSGFDCLIVSAAKAYVLFRTSILKAH